ncbi:Thioredoxin domain-containing protein 11 [Bulinus truncatus]|nr:Thioredoxin domain-containing protein 11 [Bulinus truncatus]
MADLVESNVRINLINPNELLRGMARHPELCIIITFLITFVIKYGTSFKAKPVTLPPKPPQYMFSPTTFVLDSPRGSLIPLTEVLHSKEFVFVMYYAPWCYKPKAARAEFLKAANYFKGQVPFAAVNCWWLEGECRKRYKFLMFPVFMAYNTRLDGYRYFGNRHRYVNFDKKLAQELFKEDGNAWNNQFQTGLPNPEGQVKLFYPSQYPTSATSFGLAQGGLSNDTKGPEHYLLR